MLYFLKPLHTHSGEGVRRCIFPWNVTDAALTKLWLFKNKDKLLNRESCRSVRTQITGYLVFIAKTKMRSLMIGMDLSSKGSMTSEILAHAMGKLDKRNMHPRTPGGQIPDKLSSWCRCTYNTCLQIPFIRWVVFFLSGSPTIPNWSPA